MRQAIVRLGCAGLLSIGLYIFSQAFQGSGIQMSLESAVFWFAAAWIFVTSAIWGFLRSGDIARKWCAVILVVFSVLYAGALYGPLRAKYVDVVIVPTLPRFVRSSGESDDLTKIVSVGWRLAATMNNRAEATYLMPGMSAEVAVPLAISDAANIVRVTEWALGKINRTVAGRSGIPSMNFVSRGLAGKQFGDAGVLYVGYAVAVGGLSGVLSKAQWTDDQLPPEILSVIILIDKHARKVVNEDIKARFGSAQ